jgi:hypothetical protein
VAGPRGPYSATLKKVMHDVDMAALLRHTVLVRAHPNNLADLIFEV